jgi:hypothetical protein
LSIDDEPNSDYPSPPADGDGALAAAVADARRAGGDVDPQRIVALEWLPAELLLALGVTPYGVADIPTITCG